jgi:hypothetical protein
MASKRPPNKVETLPSGVEVAYYDAIGVDGLPQQRRYLVDGERLPSVSTVAGSFEKPALMPAAVKLQEQGLIELAQRGVDVGKLTQPELRSAMWEAGLHYDAIWKQARERGDAAHDMLMALIRDGAVPDLADYPEDVRPWISAGMKFVLEQRPQPLSVEYMVASTEHGFVGRADLCAQMPDGRVARLDWKTTSSWSYKKDRDGNPTDKLLLPYGENLIALAGYEIAAVESGYLASDVRLVVRLGPDGEYDVCESHATPEVFLAALTAYTQKKYLATAPKAVAA